MGNQIEINQASFLERKDVFSREIVDIMAIIEAFPEPVRPYLLCGMQHIQFYDGCSVGCPFCGFDVRRKIKEGFDLDGWRRFVKAHIAEMPSLIALYWASDPLEIGGDGYGYVDILRETVPFLRLDQTVFTSTAMPEGTDDVLFKLFLFLHEEWLKSAILGVGTPFHTVRISMTEKNKERVEKLRLRLREAGLDSNFLKAQLDYLSDRSLEKVMRVGKFIKFSKRDVDHADFDTVACYDGVLFRPDGLYTVMVESATMESPFGQRQVRLDASSDFFEIPKYLRTTDYVWEKVLKRLLIGSSDLFIPDTVMVKFDKQGKLVGETPMLTARRLGLQLMYFLVAVQRLEKEQLVGNEKVVGLRVAFSELIKRVEKFENGEYQDMDDKEAVWLVNELWGRIGLRVISLGIV